MLGQSDGRAGSEEVVEGVAVVGLVADVGPLLLSEVFVAKPELVGCSSFVGFSVVGFTSGF